MGHNSELLPPRECALLPQVFLRQDGVGEWEDMVFEVLGILAPDDYVRYLFECFHHLASKSSACDWAQRCPKRTCNTQGREGSNAGHNLLYVGIRNCRSASLEPGA